MTQRRRFQSIGLLVTVVLSMVLLWALATLVQTTPVAYADEPLPPQIQTITVTSTKQTYFHNPGLGEEGGTVYFNSVGGEGAGQVLTVTVTVTGSMPITLAGAPAFGYNPPPDSDEPWEITYTVEMSAGTQSGIVFTVTNVSGFDTAVITFTQDNVAPTVIITDVTNPGYDSAGNELDTNGSNWYDPDNLTAGWYFTSTVTDTLSGLALANASWNHSNDAYDRLTYDPGLDGSGVFTDVADNADGIVTMTLTLTDHVGNPASDTVVFNLDNTNPTIISPTLIPSSNFLYADGFTLYYGDDMSTGVSFSVEGEAQDNGAGPKQAIYSEAFEGAPTDDDITSPPHSWAGYYLVLAKDYGSNKTLTVTVSDRVDNSATQIFTYTRDIISPTIVPTTISETSPYLYANGLVLYYSDMMGTSPQDFDVQGTASDDIDGAGFRQVTFTLAFGDTPGPDSSPSWSGRYNVVSSNNGNGNITVAAYDNVGNWSSGIFTYIEDKITPTVEITDVTDPGYDLAGNELDTNGSNWYDADNLSAGWYFTSTVTDTLSGLALANASWDHSNDAYDRLTYDPGLDGNGVFTDVADNADGAVTVTLTLTDNVGNPASDTVVFNIDNTEPTITSPSIYDYGSLWLHVNGLTIYYGDDMPSPQSFRVEGQSADGTGIGLDRAKFSGAFGNPAPFDDTMPVTWTAHYYPDNQNWGDGTITVTVSDLLNHSATQVFTYTRDTSNPSSVAGSPQYDNASPIVVTYTNATDTGGSGLQWVWLWYKKEAGGTWITSSLSPITGFAGSFNFIPTQGDGTYYFATRTEDNVGNLETEPTGSGDDSTIYDTLSPTVPVSFTYQNDTDSGGDGIQPLPGYYDNTVIQLQWNASTDDGSGLPANPYHLGTAPHPTSGSYAEDSPYNVGTSGTYTIYLTAEDRAGNISNDAATGPITVDIEGPQADINCPSSTTSLSFVVDWSATTDQGPAGLRSTNPYSVSYRVDGGSWQDWITVTVPSTVTATFGPNSPVTVEYSHTYCFRLRAVDKAGNVQNTNGTDCTQTVDPGVRKVFLPIIMTPDPNWGFELGDFTNWQHGGQLAQSVSTAMPHSGSYAALLGSPSYNCNNGVPVGSAWLRRSVTVPSSGSPTLSFWYRIYTHDKNSDPISDQYDHFAAYINGSQLVVIDANTSDPYNCSTLRNLGWKQVVFSLVTPNDYRGQTIQITFYNYNLAPVEPEWGNTYTYIDDVSVQ